MGKKVTRHMTIGEIRETCPRADEVLSKFFGPGCFSCPNSKAKTIEFGATMHGKDVDEVVAELNELNE
ncbi:MAG: DUF1858 domain-containing protein [Bacillota bacterium]|nr:DUF1858 domain-containing protein [Bacillota bacterium]